MKIRPQAGSKRPVHVRRIGGVVLAGATLFAPHESLFAQATVTPEDALEAAPDGSENAPQRVLRVQGHDIAVDFDVPQAPAELEVLRLRGRGPVGHIRWTAQDTAADADPDAALQHALVSLSEPPALLHSWTDSRARTLRAVDLDNDGAHELVRDLAGPSPCGMTLLRAPEVFDFARADFRAVSVPPSITGATPMVGAPRSPAPAAASRGFDAATHDETFAGFTALNDADPTTHWREGATGPGLGQWVALRAPESATVTGVRLSADESEGPVRVLIQFDDGATFTTDVDGLYREIPVQTTGRCAIITAYDLIGRASLTFTEAALVTNADTMSASERVVQVWPQAIRAACADNDSATAHAYGERALADARNSTTSDASSAAADPAYALAATFASEDNRCGVQAIVRTLSPAEDGVRAHVAMTPELNLETTSELLRQVTDTASVPELTRALSTLSEQHRTGAEQYSPEREHAFAETLVRVLAVNAGAAPNAASEPPAADLTDYFSDVVSHPVRTQIEAAAPSSRATDAIEEMSTPLSPIEPTPVWADTQAALTALETAPHAGFSLSNVWGFATTDDARILVLRLAFAARHMSISDDDVETVRAAMNHENGSVARLAVRVAGTRGMSALAPELRDIASTDPIGHMREAAILALDALGQLEPERWLADESADVRLAVASSDALAAALAGASNDAQPHVMLADALAREPWPEVRAAWTHAAIDADRAELDEIVATHAASAPRAELAAALRAWTSRGTTAPETAVAAGRAYGPHPETLAYTVALSPVSTAGCDVGWLRSMRDGSEIPEGLQAVIDEVMRACSE